MDRNELIARIKSKMEEQGLNQRSLALKAGLKPDSVKNLFEGKSYMLRADRLDAVLKVLGLGPFAAAAYDTEAMRAALEAMEKTIERLNARLSASEKAVYLERLYALAARERELGGPPAIGAAAAEHVLKTMQH